MVLFFCMMWFILWLWGKFEWNLIYYPFVGFLYLILCYEPLIDCYNLMVKYLT